MTPATLFNHLWQSTVFALAAAAVAWGLRRHQARVRFWVWMAASVKFLVPFSALAGLGAALGRLLPAPAAAAAAPPAALAALSQAFQTRFLQMPDAAAAAAPGPAWLGLLAGVWLAGSAALALRWGLRWQRLARVARAATPEGGASLPVRATAAAIEPGIFGLFRPVLLLPASLRHRLTHDQFEAVVAHERCHLRRRDNLWSALHMLVETVFWFHPLTWWMGARLVAERERACDEEVLRQGGNRHAYASGLVQVCRHYMESPLPCAAGIGGGPLAQRVAAILEGGRGRNLGRGRKLALAGLGAAALVGPLAAGIVFAQSTPPAPTSFDAASIKPAAPPSGGRIFKGMRTEPTRLTAQNMSLKELIEAAYGLKPYQVVGPAWISSENFDVSAETSAPVARDKIALLLAPFLEKQFDLKTHRSSKVMNVYALVVNDKSKLKPATADTLKFDFPDTPEGKRMSAAMAARGRGPVPAGAMMINMNGHGMTLVANASMAQLTNMLARQLDRPVLDRTALDGSYAIRLTYAPPPGAFGGMVMMKRDGMRGGGGAARGDSGPGPGNGPPTTDAAAPAPSLFTALQQQLGLKLDPRKAPVDLLIVDSANKTPVWN